jgi:protein involved in polysaccharide export with SLBB domain
MKKITSFVLLFCLCCVFLIPASASEYVLAPNDQLEIKIIGQSDLDTKQTIAPDWRENNWYKILTGAAVIIGAYVAVHR